jgi:hypothetical protein
MEITSHDILRFLVIAFPMLVVGVWAWAQGRRIKKNREISEALRRRSDESVVTVVGVPIGGEGGDA